MKKKDDLTQEGTEKNKDKKIQNNSLTKIFVHPILLIIYFIFNNLE